jgi:hypothetical protein
MQARPYGMPPVYAYGASPAYAGAPVNAHQGGYMQGSYATGQVYR